MTNVTEPEHHELAFTINGFTGKDVFYSFFLPESWHAKSIARRLAAQKFPGNGPLPPLYFVMPSGKSYRILDRSGNVEVVDSATVPKATR